MSQIKIVLEINSIAELEGLEYALELFSESERERLDDEGKSTLKGEALAEYNRARSRQAGAARLLTSIRGR